MTDRSTSPDDGPTPHADGRAARFAEAEVRFGRGGDTHQVATGDTPALTTQQGMPVSGRLTLDRVVDNFFAETEQVAFHTGNIVPGIDFSDDPLLQGRNFSYLDTQLKRLGSPNFTHIQVNAPMCPVHNLQQDGHMAMRNPQGRANYEPNSWGADGGPRESVETGFASVPRHEAGPVRRVRADSFADHYSQARQVYSSQAPVEQSHIGDALVFELSKVDTPTIRRRVVSHLRHIDEDLASHNGAGSPAAFVEQCRQLRYWPREQAVDQT